MLISSAEIWRRGYKSLVTNAGKAIAVITLVISALVIFTDVGIVSADFEALTSTLLLMLIASYVMYFSMESAGEKLGMESDEYKEALKIYKSAVSAISPKTMPKMREFCKEYSKEEAKYRQEIFLLRHGLTPKSPEEYRCGKEFSPRERRAIRRAERIRPAKLTPADLLSIGDARSEELANPERMRSTAMMLKMLPTALCTLFTASVVLGTKESLDAPAVIEGLLKLSTLAIIGLRGYTAGYFFAKGRLLGWLETKTKLVLAFKESIETSDGTD